MSKVIEKIDKASAPVLITRGIIVFPEVTVSFEVDRLSSQKALDYISKNGNTAVITSRKSSDPDEGKPEDVYMVGTLCRVKQILKTQDSSVRILVEGMSRVEISSMEYADGFFTAKILKKTLYLIDGGIKSEAALSETHKIFERYCKYIPKISAELSAMIHTIKEPGILADFIAANIYLSTEKKQQVLEEFDPLRRLERLCVILEKELQILEIEEGIHKKVRRQIDKNQRDYYLREQLKALQGELGINEFDSEIDEYREMLEEKYLPDEVYEKLSKELMKLQKMPFGSPEGTVIRNYLDVCLDIPWDVKTKDRANIETAARILNEDHDGLEKVKERILEFIAVKQIQPALNGQVLCLAGPPGVGKTSVAASIAKALNRKYIRVSLGGIRDEAEIRGHRKTYIGAMPGRIINAVKQAGSMNPLILLDEIDKLSRDAHGDPSSALLEVLDTEQNKAFRDHFIELPIDLSDCLFVTTANTLDTIPRPLADRMEIISLSSYTRLEKHVIAKNHLTTKQLKKHGLNKRNVKISDEAIFEIIDYYTREAGVRNLEREIAAICRKSAKRLVAENKKSIAIGIKQVNEMLGVRKYKDDSYSKENEVGVVNGLAWTAMGGEILQVEIIAVNGTGKIELTGSLGDVMKESARAAISFLRTIAEKYGIDPDFYKNKDIHIHFPEGAVPKDGPSAGITIATAIFSQLTGYPVRSDVAMTGEITLRGKVLPIGGLKEKTIAAYRSHMKTVIIPDDNVPDLEEIDAAVRENIEFVPVKRAEEVFEKAVIFPQYNKICTKTVSMPTDISEIVEVYPIMDNACAPAAVSMANT